MPASPSWFPDEVALAGRENLDEVHVARYDGKMDANAAAEVELLAAHGLNSNSAVAEFGPGTGQFTLAVAPRCKRVIAIDVSPPMLRSLGGKVTAGGIRNVELVQSGFLSYSHVGDPVDFIYSRYALHHLPDFWKAVALQRMRSILRPGGVLRLWDVVYDFPPTEAEARIEAWCAMGGDGVEGEWSRAELEEHVRDEHSSFSWILDPMIERCGFEIVDVQRTRETFDSRYVLQAT